MTNLSSGRLQVSNMIYEDSKSVVIFKQKLLIFKLYLKERRGNPQLITHIKFTLAKMTARITHSRHVTLYGLCMKYIKKKKCNKMSPKHPFLRCNL